MFHDSLVGCCLQKAPVRQTPSWGGHPYGLATLCVVSPRTCDTCWGTRLSSVLLLLPQWRPMGKTRHQCHGMGEGSTSLSCGVVCHQAWNDVWVVSPVAERRAPLAWPESPASGSPQSAPAEACRHGPAGVESAVSRSPYRSALGRHSLSEFLLACVYFPSENSRHSSPHEPRSRTIPWRCWPLRAGKPLGSHDATFPAITRVSCACGRPHGASAWPVSSSLGRASAGRLVQHIPPHTACVGHRVRSRLGHAACPVSPYAGAPWGSRPILASSSSWSSRRGALDARCSLAATRRCALSCCFCWRARSFSRFWKVARDFFAILCLASMVHSARALLPVRYAGSCASASARCRAPYAPCTSSSSPSSSPALKRTGPGARL